MVMNPAGVLAKGALYYCKKPSETSVCGKQLAEGTCGYESLEIFSFDILTDAVDILTAKDNSTR